MDISRAILWTDTATGRESFASLNGEVKADVAVVGAGIMGTATALTLASRGASVLVLEARRVGSGASSRPGGFVVPAFSFSSPRMVIETLGETGERLIHMVGNAANRVYELVRKHGICCAASQAGWYQPAHSQAAWRRTQQIAQEWAAAGFEAQLIDGADTRRRTGVAGYVGSWLAPSGGTLQPSNYTLGLADAAVRAGARVFEHTQIRSIDRSAGKLVLIAGSGRAVVDRVVLCTNGRSMGPYAELQNSIVPLKIWQCATEPLELSARRHLFQRGECLSDTRANLFTYRFDHNWRLITGMLSTLGFTAGMAAAAMAYRLRKHLKLPRSPRIDYIWSGTASVTRNCLPQLSVFPDGVIAPVACNGRGIALSTVAGQAVANLVLDGKMKELPLPMVTPSGRATIMLQRSLAPLHTYYGFIKDLARLG